MRVKALSGTCCAGGRVHVDVFQRVGILLELRIDFQDHVVLVQLREDGGDLALAEGVVERVVDVRGVMPRREAVSRSMTSVAQQALVLLVAGDVAQFPGCDCSFSMKLRRPVSQFLGVDIFQGVLILRAADAVFHGQVLHRLHEERNAVDFRPARAAGGE